MRSPRCCHRSATASRLKISQPAQLALTLRRAFELDRLHTEPSRGGEICVYIVNKDSTGRVQGIRLQKIVVNRRFWLAQVQATGDDFPGEHFPESVAPFKMFDGCHLHV